MEAHEAKYGKKAAVIFLQNHGVFAGAGDTNSIKAVYASLMQKIAGRIRREPDFSAETASSPAAEKIRPVLAELSGGAALFLSNNEIAALVKDSASFGRVSSAFTPDHIVYAGSDPLFVENPDQGELRQSWKNHRAKTGRDPKITAVQGIGVFGTCQTEKASALALELFRDAVRISVYSENFGGPLFMSGEQIDFINNWEAERFRSGVSKK
jgi:rhamnose utilization protein RhaD (predicted bifunctional aldolase and dehydrogenase)